MATTVLYVRQMPLSFALCLDKPLGLAILDSVDFDSHVCITRINVPEQHRGKGHASKLLKECIEASDNTQTILELRVSASGGLTNKQLEQWYKRYGFEKKTEGIMERVPDEGSKDYGWRH